MAREVKERAITRPLQHLNRIFGLGGSLGVAPELGSVVHPTVDVLGSHLLKANAAWFETAAVPDALTLEFQKDADKLDRVFRFLYVGLRSNDGTSRIFNLFIRENTSGVQIPVTDSVTMDSNARASVRDVVLPPGDWRLRATISALGAGLSQFLSGLYVHHDVGEYFA